MRRLILLRHAKTETDAPSGKDHDRRLDERGRVDAAAIGEWLAEQRLVPDQVLVSTATRTRQTWDILADLFPAAPPRRSSICRNCTAPARRNCSQAIHEVSAGINRLMLVGHNPGLQELALGPDLRRATAPTASC